MTKVVVIVDGDSVNMFYECYLVIWSAVTLLFGGPVLVEIQKRGDSLYYQEYESMLLNFPLKDFLHCSYETECKLS